MKKSFSVILGSAFLAASLTSPTAGAQELRIGAHRSLMGAWEVVADKKGYWKEEGLKYTIQSFKQGKIMRDAIIQGNLDTGTTGFGPFTTAMAKGAKLEAIGVTANICGITGIFVPVNSTAKSVADLKGKTFATKKGTSTDFSFKEYVLPRYGLKENDLEWLSINATDRVAALVSGSAQAAIIGDPQAEIAVRKGFVRKLEDFCAYDKTRMMAVANPETLKAHPDLYAKYFRGWLKAQKLLRDDPEEFARVYTAALNEIGDKTSYDIILPVVKRLQSDPYITTEVLKYLNDMGDKQVKLGWIKSHPDFTKATTAFNDAPLRQAAGELGIKVQAAAIK